MSETKLEKLQAKEAQIKEQIKQEKAKLRAQERKARNHRLIEVGATVESVLGRPIEKEDLPKLQKFLQDQEDRGGWFGKAML